MIHLQMWKQAWICKKTLSNESKERDPGHKMKSCSKCRIPFLMLPSKNLLNVYLHSFPYKMLILKAFPMVLYSHACVLSRFRFFVNLQTAARQALLSLGFSRQECWNGLSLCAAKRHCAWPQRIYGIIGVCWSGLTGFQQSTKQ